MDADLVSEFVEFLLGLKGAVVNKDKLEREKQNLLN